MINIYAESELSTSTDIISVRVGGPNAGHCVIDPDTNHKYAFRTVPVGMIYGNNPRGTTLTGAIAAGSEIDLNVLENEVRELMYFGSLGRKYTLLIDPQATILTPDHIRQEQESSLKANVGSTTKGIGAARADRIWRTAPIVADLLTEDSYEIAHEDLAYQLQRIVNTSDDIEIKFVNVAKYIHEKCRDSRYNSASLTCTIIEGTQGYGLGLHAGHYPQCTSNDARCIDFQAMAGVSPEWYDTSHNVGATRPNPIRVAGNSGQLKGETTWDELGQEVELTTVTQKVRRVGEWDPELIKEAVAMGALHTQVLTMADKVFPALKDMDKEGISLSEFGQDVIDWVHGIEAETQCVVSGFTTSENTIVWLDPR